MYVHLYIVKNPVLSCQVVSKSFLRMDHNTCAAYINEHFSRHLFLIV